MLLAGAFVASPVTDFGSNSGDGYVPRRSIDGLFLKIAEAERRIRENLLARTTDLLQRIFGAVKR